MLSISKNCIRQRYLSNVLKTSLRFNSNSTGDKSAPGNKNEIEIDPLLEPYYDAEVNQDGIYVNKVNQNQEELFKLSNFSKNLNEVKLKKSDLVDSKLKLLSKSYGLEYTELIKLFNAKLINKQKLIDSNLNKIELVLKNYDNLLVNSTNLNKINENLIYEIIENYLLSNYNSKLFTEFNKIDPFFNKLIQNFIISKNESDLVLVFNYLNDSDKKITKFLDDETNFKQVSKLLSDKSGLTTGTTTTTTTTTTAPQSIPTTDSFNKVKGEEFLNTLFNYFNSFNDIKETELFSYLSNTDSSFAKLLKDYSELESNNEEIEITEELINSKYNNILNYISNENSTIFKKLNLKNDESLNNILNKDKPIQFELISNLLNYQLDPLNNSIFNKLIEIDSKLTNELIELSKIDENLENSNDLIQIKNVEIDHILNSKDSKIFNALNNIDSTEYKSLKKIVDSELERCEKIIPLDELLEFLIIENTNEETKNSELVNNILNFIKEKDLKFYEILSNINFKELSNLSEEETLDNKDLLNLENYYNDENSNIFKILNNIEGFNTENNELFDLLYKDNEILKDQVKELESQDKSESESKETNTQFPTGINNISTTNSPILNEIQLLNLQNEDQSILTQDERNINEHFDLWLESINELQKDLENDSLFQINESLINESKKVLNKFDPSEEQLNKSESLKSVSLPNEKDEVLDLCVNLIMKDGLKNKAKTQLNKALYLIYLELRKNPVDILKEALDMAAPLVITKVIKTGFAKNYSVPIPLTPRQRNRMAFNWILSSCDSKASNDFSVRLSEEIIQIIGGKSKLFDKKQLAHRLAITNRSYLKI
ncbi:hypothetical protein BVG19_g3932 [[Candida] boidinii]|nr:hypothetical protein BVG19_g3932 [[Candida] boidinii]OWB51547.1 hypothetical protein B5S27_g3111 [[Candida] boidinii]